MSFPNHAVIITAAGSSERFNANQLATVKKEYLNIDGHTVLYRSIIPFLQIPNCLAIIVTYPAGMQDQCAVALEDLLEQNEIPIILVEGGHNRQASVFNGLKMISNMGLPVDYVAIHDGARCYVSEALVIRTLATATICTAAVPALPPTDAMKTIDENGMIVSHIDRHSAVGVQTPQIFKFPEIYQAHIQAKDKDITYIDDSQIFTDFGMHVAICEGERENKKVTYMEDIPDAENQIEEYTMLLEEGKRKYEAAKALHQAMDEVRREQE